MFDPKQSIAELVLEHSECAQVFQRHRIDYCCRGAQSLEAAARITGVELWAMTAELAAAIAKRTSGCTTADVDPRAQSAGELLAQLLRKRHAYLRENIPLIHMLGRRVGRVHRLQDRRLPELACAVEALAQALSGHLDHEELAVLSALPSKLEESALAAMRQEHRALEDQLSCVHALREGLSASEWACNSARTLFSELAQLERDVLTQVQLEDHLLAAHYKLMSTS